MILITIMALTGSAFQIYKSLIIALSGHLARYLNIVTDAKVALIQVKSSLSINTATPIKLLTAAGLANIISLEQPQQLLDILKPILKAMAMIRMER